MGSGRGNDVEGKLKRRSGYLWRAQTVTTHAVQCAKCGKYRNIPDKGRYEIIRERIRECPWVCKDALDWDSSASCDLPDEMTESSKFILTADKPGIPATPEGWERTVHIRGGPNHGVFSDVFYFAPRGAMSQTLRRMRSYHDVERTAKKYPRLFPPNIDIRRRFCFATPTPPPQNKIASRSTPKKSYPKGSPPPLNSEEYSSSSPDPKDIKCDSAGSESSDPDAAKASK